MMFSRLPSALCLSLFAALTAAEASCVTKTITIQAWPLSSSKPTPLAKVLETSCPSSPRTYSLSDYTPPPHESPEYKHVRVGHFIGSQSTSAETLDNWDGILTSSTSFTPGWRKTLTLLTDSDGNFAHASFGATQRKLQPGEEEVTVEVRHPSPGTRPVLNKPVVLDETGKVKVEEKDERSFLQK